MRYYCINRCTQSKADSRKREGLDDVTKHFLFHKTAISTKKNVPHLTSLLQFSWGAACVQMAMWRHMSCLTQRSDVKNSCLTLCNWRFHMNAMYVNASESLEHWNIEYVCKTWYVGAVYICHIIKWFIASIVTFVYTLATLIIIVIYRLNVIR